MTLEYSFACPLVNGIHARPASAIERIAEKFNSEIFIVNGRSGRKANAKSVLSMVGADFKFNDSCNLIVAGQDEKAAFEKVHTFLKDDFALCDEPLPEIKAADGQVILPPMLRNTGVKFYSGTGVVNGIGKGQAVFFDNMIAIPEEVAAKAGKPDIEEANVSKAINSVEKKIRLRQAAASDTEAAILEAHLSILRDPELAAYIFGLIESERCSAGKAIREAAEHFSSILRATGSLILRERILDIQDVSMTLLKEIYGDILKSANVLPARPCVCITDNLTPSQFLSLDRTFLKGLVLANAGTTSHTIILARSFGIPTITGVQNLDNQINNAEVILDGDLGILVTEISEQVKKYYEREEKKAARKKQQLKNFISAQKGDGQIEVGANVSDADEIAAAVKFGADGIGVFRTEMLFLGRNSAPDEQDQFEIYKRAAENAGGRPVIIRSIDIGGDKHLEYLKIPAEANPFLGYRAVRIYSEFANIIKNQFRAILRASALGKIKLMIPMVSCVEEVRQVKEILAEIRSQLDSEKIAYDKSMHVGIMVEVPSVAFIIEQLAKEIDFFSIGTNDLLQYFVATDRQNEKVSALYTTLHPSFIRLLKKIVDDVHASGKWVGMCGEMAGDIQNLPILIGLRLDEISLSASNIPSLKAAISRSDLTQCKRIIESAMQCTTVEEIEQLLKSINYQNTSLPIIDTNLIVLGSESRSRHEVIKEAVDNLYVFGRTEQPSTVEEEIWKREGVYSTGLGYGFAVPHCSSDGILSNCISIVKLKHPVDWNSSDSKPVDIVIMLAIRSSEKDKTHMQIFSRLARKIMHEEFRDFLRGANDAETILKYIKSSLELA